MNNDKLNNKHQTELNYPEVKNLIKKVDCKHNWKVFNIVKEIEGYNPITSSTALYQVEYAYWSCDKCLIVKKIKVL